MQYNPANPLIVQGDRTILLEVDNPLHAEARDAIAPFAELEKSPEHIHTYRLTPLSLWNAAAAGMSAEAMVEALETYSKFPLPGNLPPDLRELVGRYGRVRLQRVDGQLRLITGDRPLLEELARQRGVRDYLGERVDETSFAVDDANRGVLKQALIAVGYPAEDLAGYTAGAALPMAVRQVSRAGLPFQVRDYQTGAVAAFYAGGDARGGSGVIVLPCGAGKTIVGLAAMAALQTETLVLTTSTTAVEQWKREILDKTDIDPALVGTYTGDSKTMAPVTLATYQIVTYRPKKDGDFPHFHLFDGRDWGLIIYDEVHLLPAPVFRITADIQARRRLGLTATLVREDHREEDVFSLIGPKKYDVPWRVLESKGWIAEAQCHEVRLGLPGSLRMEYAVAEWREKFRLASENPLKDDLVATLLDRYDHPEDRVLVIGQYLKQLRRIADRFDIPLITGQTPNSEREDALRQVPPRGDPPAGALEGRQLRDRPARCQRHGPGLRAPSAAGRRRRSGWAGSSAPRRGSGPRASTRWSAATPARWTSPTTASSSSPSRATAMRSSTRPDLAAHGLLKEGLGARGRRG